MRVESNQPALTDLSDEAISAEAKEDILELEGKISAFRSESMDSEKFRAFRLTRGVYGQRQEGVQMIRIKLPFGKITPLQLEKVAEVSDAYAAGNLHLTTRQDIQIHYVKLENSPKVWSALETVGVTLREACGNTVRNITASAMAGIDPNEPFDVTSYAYEHFKYFLRNPICQEMGRKFKVSFSSSEEDSAFGFMHDLGFIPKVKIVNGEEVRGFKVFLGGGLGAQPYFAEEAYDFLPEDQTIPMMEAVIRVFDRYGERNKRHKARMKYLVNGLGMPEFMKLVDEERAALKSKSYIVNREVVPATLPDSSRTFSEEQVQDEAKYKAWLETNVFEQKQKGWHGVHIKQHLGDLSTDGGRALAQIVRRYASEDIRITVNQGWLLRFVAPAALPGLFNALDNIGLAQPGFDSTADVTACPGTDTCNLGISSSTGIAAELEKMILHEYPDLIFNKNIKIKISGCMNACGQHTIANIGFHGMSIKNGVLVLPAMQLLLGGGFGKDGKPTLADKVVKLPTRRCIEAVRYLLNDYDEHHFEGEYFNDYYRRAVAADKMYFYKLLKPLADLTTLTEIDYIDFGHTDKYVTEVGIGECAGVMLDLVATLISETEDKISKATRLFDSGAFADSIYQSYATFVSGAKAMLMADGINCNTQIGIINDFEMQLLNKGLFQVDFANFKEYVLQITNQEPTQKFAAEYLQAAQGFLSKIVARRQGQLLAIK